MTTDVTPAAALPPRLAELVDDFAGVEVKDRLLLLLELSEELPALPARYVGRHEDMEQVHECQTPLFLAVELEGTGPTAVVRLFFDAPPEAPTTRGFASIMSTGLDGENVATVLEVPNDFYTALGLGAAVSPLRLRGMVAMLSRIKNRVRAAGGS